MPVSGLTDEIDFKVFRSRVKLPIIFLVPAALLGTLYALVYLYANSGFFLDTLTVTLNAQLGGQYEVAELVVDPTLTNVEVYDAEVRTPDGEPAITAARVDASLNPLVLLTGRISVDEAVVRGADVRLVFDEEGRLGLLEAVGVDQDDDSDEAPDEPGGISIEFAHIEVHGSEFHFVNPDFDFHVPDIDLPRGSVTIEPGTLLMRVPELDVPRVDFRFSSDLVGMGPEADDWEFTVEPASVRDWRWAGDGFVVERVGVTVDGVEIEAGGQMAFPGGEGDDAPVITYDAEATASVAYWSPVAQYFIGDAVHFEVPTMEVAARGSLRGIDGGVALDASVIEAAGLRFQDVQGVVSLHNEWLELQGATARLHGGDIELDWAFFNMFNVDYAAIGRFEGVNPRGVLGDFGVDLDYLDGRLSGAFDMYGGVPLDYDYEGADSLPLVEFASRRYADVRLTEDWVLRRHNQALFPGSVVRLSEGTRVWVDPYQVAVEGADVAVGPDRLEVDWLAFDYQRLAFEPDAAGQPTRLTAHLTDAGRWLGHYGVDGVRGPVRAEIGATGPLSNPTVALAVVSTGDSLTLPEVAEVARGLPVRRLAVDARLDDGRLSVRELEVGTDAGDVSVRGWIEVLTTRAGPDGPRLAVRRHNPAKLAVEVRRADLSRLGPMLGAPVDLSGRLDAEARLTGSLQRPIAETNVRVRGASVAGQPVASVDFDGGLDGQAVVARSLTIDAGGAGTYRAEGRFGFDGDYAFDFVGREVDLDYIAALQDVPEPARPHGKARISLHGDGSLARPDVAGSIQLHGLRVGQRELGEAALVANTVDETVYLVGGLLPLVSLHLEVPLDASSPFYLRVGIEQLDLVAAVDELRRTPVVSQATASGTVELFVEKDMSRYQVVTNLTQLDVHTLGHRVRNRGPIVIGLNNGEVLQIQQAALGTRGKYVSVEGAMGLDPMLLDLRMRGDLDLSMLNTARRIMPDAFPAALVHTQGEIGVDASVRGPLSNPIADGSLEFKAAELAVRDLPDPVRISAGRVEFSRGRIAIAADEPVRGSALGGVFRLTGEVGLIGGVPGPVDARLWTHNMTYRVADAANLTFDTDLGFAAGDIAHPSTWLVSGQVDILDGRFYRDISLFEEQVAGRVLGAFDRTTERYEEGVFEQTPELGDIAFDVSLRARDGFEIENQIDRLALDLELRIDLRLTGRLLDPELLGDIDVIDGQLAFQGEQFEVRSGTVRFAGNPQNPWVDVLAGADVRNRCREESFEDEINSSMQLGSDVDRAEQQYYHVLLHLRGYADNLDIQFESNPYADQRDVLSLLLTGCTVDQLTASSASGPTLEIALGPLLGRIEKEVQDVVKVSEFTIMPGVERTQLRIGDRVTRRLSWNFRLDTGMSDRSGGQRYQLEYKLSDQWSAEVSERSHTETNNLLLDLKLKYRLPLD